MGAAGPSALGGIIGRGRIVEAMEMPHLSTEREQLDSLPKGLPLIVAIPGYHGTACVGQRVADHMLDSLTHRTVVEFNADRFIDHRARRPTMRFERDHIAAFQLPRLALSLLLDDAGRECYLLHGAEPDYHWEEFAELVARYARQLEVSQVVAVLSAAMPVPHTRPIIMTVSGNSADMVEKHSAWRPIGETPAAWTQLLEYRMVASFRFTTFFVYAPNYLGPAASSAPTLKALEGITDATGLLFRTDALHEHEREFQQAVAAEMEEQDELRAAIHAMEERYDGFLVDADQPSPLMTEDGTVPRGEDIAAELERFLNMRRERGDDRGTQ